MYSAKTSMSISYKAVFTLSILMIFLVIIGGAISGSKSVGFGIWYWGYIAWKMYRRDNDSLISLQKIMLWFQSVAFSIALVVLLFSDSDVRRNVDVTPIGLIFFAAFSMSVTFLLYKFFKQKKSASTTSSIAISSLIEDKFWEQASRELESNRHEATWARAYSNAEGDESKAKALYLNYRALALNANESVNRIVANTEYSSAKKLSFSLFSGPSGNWVLLLMVIFFTYLLFCVVSVFNL